MRPKREEQFVVTMEADAQLAALVAATEAQGLVDKLGPDVVQTWPAVRALVEAAEAVLAELGYDDQSVEAYNAGQNRPQPH
jgi:hypothetical protein